MEPNKTASERHRSKRRKVIIGVVVFLIVLVLLILVVIMKFAPEAQHDALVIIIGAGPAGIAAASRLFDHNIKDILILEAEDRIGGRIHSLYFGDAIVDLGAQYVHGQKDNLVYELAKDYVKTDFSILDTRTYYSGRRKTGDDFFSTFLTLVEETPQYGKPNVSIGEVYLNRFNATIIPKYKHDSEMLTYAKNFQRNIECYVDSLEGSYNWFESTSTSNFVDNEGTQNLEWDGLGYVTILQILLKNFPEPKGYNIDDQLRYEKTVSKITLNDNSVGVKCEDGSEYTAKHVIFTPSLGVLKEEHENLFEPALDPEKVIAIENLGFGGVMKVIFEFPNAWWEGVEVFFFVWNDKEKRRLINEIPYGPVHDGDHWLSWFYTVGTSPKNPRVLIGWLAGPLVPEIEQLSEEEITNGTIFALRKFLGRDFNVTDPLKVIHSKWCTNPHFRGTYSYETVKLQQMNIASANTDLLQPINGSDETPRILFAGEATNPTRYATVDGAIGTGFREADRLIDYLKK